MTPTDDLVAELVGLGRAIDVGPPPDDLAEVVLRRIAVRPASGRDRLRRRVRRSTRRWVAVVVLLLLIALGLTPPVRAALRDWLDFGGVLIRTGPAPTTTVTPTPDRPTPGPTEPSESSAGPARVVTLAQARAEVSFDLALPRSLGRPDRIEVTADRRVVSMTWGAGASALRLDQFDGTVAWIFVKQIGAPVRFVEVDGRDGVWIAEPHPIAYLDRDGRERTESARLAGPSLLWERAAPRGTVTQRLEGPSLDRQRAVTLAGTLR